MAGPVALAARLPFVGPAPKGSVISASRTSWSAFSINDFMRSWSSDNKTLRSIGLALCFFTVMVCILLQDTGLIFAIS